jgi:hypothetical protein
MSVGIRYKGRFDNHAFQYACARLFALDQGLRLLTEFPAPDQEILPASAPETGAAYEEPVFGLGEGDQVFGRRVPPGKYVLDGYFQRAAWYYDRRADVGRIFRPAPLAGKNYEDIVINVRLGDYRACRMVIHPRWYLGILERESFRRPYVVSDEQDDEYLAHFRAYDPTFVAGPPARQ